MEGHDDFCLFCTSLGQNLEFLLVGKRFICTKNSDIMPKRAIYFHGHNENYYTLITLRGHSENSINQVKLIGADQSFLTLS